jgi:hypothetical protein
MSFHLETEIGLDRVTNVLEDLMLKIYVNQETEGGQEWSRFGVVKLNLSEFSGARETTRKSLLEQSQTNAALSVSIFSVLKSGGAPFFKVPESSKKFVMLEDEEEQQTTGDGNTFKVHKAEDNLISDQRYMVRERENLQLPPHIVSTREDNVDVVEEVLAKTLAGVLL